MPDAPSPAAAPDPLPAAKMLLEAPPTENHQRHEFAMPPNTQGQATKQRKKHSSLTNLPLVPGGQESNVFVVSAEEFSEGITLPSQLQPTFYSRTTQYRHKKRAEAGLSPKYKRVKANNQCKNCGHPKNKIYNHLQYFGKWYCPGLEGANGKTGEQWLAEMRVSQPNPKKKKTQN